jgi:hypothetical protein
MGQRLLPDGRWSTYDVSVLKKMGGGGGRCAQTGHPLKLPSPTNIARLGHFPPASQAGRLAGPVFYVYVFSLINTNCGGSFINGKLKADGYCIRLLLTRALL